MAIPLLKEIGSTFLFASEKGGALFRTHDRLRDAPASRAKRSWEINSGQLTACLPDQTGSFFAASVPGAADSMPVEATSDGRAVFASCFNRAQRRKTLLVSVMACIPYLILRRLLIALAFDEGTVDMMFGDKLPDDLGEFGRHGHLIDQIVAGVGEPFAFRWISGDTQQFVRRPRSCRTQNDPQRRCARCEIVAIVGRLGAVQFDHGLARIEQGHFCFHAERRPGGGGGASDKNRDRSP